MYVYPLLFEDKKETQKCSANPPEFGSFRISYYLGVALTKKPPEYQKHVGLRSDPLNH